MRTLRLSLVGMAILTLGVGSAVASSEATVEEAASAETIAWTEATVEVLSDVGIIPLEAIPDDADHVTYARISVQPGTSGSSVGGAPQVWSNVEYVDGGTLTGSAQDDRVFWRADGAVEEVPAGQTVTMGSGDTVLSWNGAAASEWQNPGPDEWVSFFVGAGNSLDPATAQVPAPGVEWRHLDYIFPMQAILDDWFSAPIAVSYERITWEPGQQLVLGPEDVPMLSFIWLESGRLAYDQVGAGEVTTPGLAFTLPTEMTWLGQTPIGDTVHVLRNEGDAPAVAMGVTLSHAADQ